MNEEELIERLRGPSFGTQTALDAADAIERWKRRAERMADAHRGICVENGRLESELLSLRRKMEEMEVASAPEQAVKGLEDTNAIETALAKLRWYGIDIASPRDGDLDDLEQERYNGFVDACRAYLAALQQAKP